METTQMPGAGSAPQQPQVIVVREKSKWMLPVVCVAILIIGGFILWSLYGSNGARAYVGQAITSSASGACSSATMTVVVSGASLSGTGTTTAGQSFTVTGTASGNTIQGTWKLGTSDVGTFTGTMSKDSMTGTWIGLSNCNGTFQLARNDAAVPPSQQSSNNNSNQTGDTDNNGTPSGGQVTQKEFPWSNYSSPITMAVGTSRDKAIASIVSMGGSSRATLVIAQTLSMGAAANVQTAYVFDTVSVTLGGSIQTLYYTDATVVSVNTGATIVKKIKMTNNELVDAAMAAAGIGGGTGSTGGATKTPVSNAGTPPPQQTQQPSASSYIGAWSGTFAPNATAGALGCPGGTVSFTVTADGKFNGPVRANNGGVYYGGGSVDKNGNMSGGWSLSSGGNVKYGTINLSGKLSGNNGSGTWNVPGGCFGTFSISR